MHPFHRTRATRLLLCATFTLGACDASLTDTAERAAPSRSSATIPGAAASIDVGYGPDLFYYLRHDPVAANFSTFGTIATTGSIIDRFGVGNDFTALTFAAPDVGYGPNLFYYLRRDPANANFATFGTIEPSGVVIDRFGVGANFDALTFAAADLGYGANLFYYLRRDPANANFATFGTISTAGVVTDRFGVGADFDALTFVAADLGYGPNLFYYLRRDPTNADFSTFGTIATNGAVTDRFGVGTSFHALTFATSDLGYGAGLFYSLRTNPIFGDVTLGTISPLGDITDRFGVGLYVDDLTFAQASEPAELGVGIDVRPGEFPNVVPPKSQGQLTVAILASATFDPASVSVPSVRFGRLGTEAPAVHVDAGDVNGDGLADLSLRFMIHATGIACGDVVATLTGLTTGGVPIRGSDSIVTPACR